MSWETDLRRAVRGSGMSMDEADSYFGPEDTVEDHRPPITLNEAHAAARAELKLIGRAA